MFDLKSNIGYACGYADNNLNPASLISSTFLNIGNISRPYLEILVQPEASYRFRYDTEGGSHGCLKGLKKDMLDSNKGHKTYPTVKLNNYSEEAIIKCELYQFDIDKEHVHSLEDRKGDSRREVSNNNDYTVSFNGLWIKMDTQCSSKRAKNLDNKERSVIFTEIAELEKTFWQYFHHWMCYFHFAVCRLLHQVAAFVQPVSVLRDHARMLVRDLLPNSYKSANPTTNELKIIDYIPICGSPRGGEKILMFVDKIPAGARKIQVNFFEEGWAPDNGKWKETIPIMDYNVHRQFAISFNTPPYKNKALKVRVKVFIELERLKDGNRSKPREFTYSPSSLARLTEPQLQKSVAVQTDSSMMTPVSHYDTDSQDTFNIEELIDSFQPNTRASHGDNVGLDTVASAVRGSINLDHQIGVSDPVLTNFDVSRSFAEPMETASSEPTDYNKFRESFSDYFMHDYRQSYEDSELESIFQLDQGFNLRSDGIQKESQERSGGYSCCGTNSLRLEDRIQMLIQDVMSNLKKDFEELCREMRLRLELLFGIKDSNGDTFLHKWLNSHLTSFKYIVRVVSAMHLYDLLNAVNGDRRTVLHLAIINEMPNIVPFLIEKGCDPTLRDIFGFNAVHLAVKYPYSLKPLLSALIEKEDNEKVELILDRSFGDLGTPLHLAIELDRVECVKLLLESGANPLGTTRDGVNTVHLAVLKNNLEILRTILAYVPENDLECVVNQPLCLPYADPKANMTPLQIACDGHRVKMMQLLLEKKACPYKTEDPHKPACETAKQHPDMWAIMKYFVNDEHRDNETSDDYSDNESDEEVYFSADEGESDIESGILTKMEAVRL